MKKRYLHVIAGKIKGRRIECPLGEIRPMTSIVKEALFNIIGDCSGMKILDLFSGSGSISIEAYSRGAESAVIVEKDYGKKETILKNLSHSGFTNAKVIISDAFSYCRNCNEKFDFIMIDPPYRMENKEDLIKIISERDLLTENGFVVIQLPKKYKIDQQIGDLYCYDRRSYGLNSILFFKRIK